MARALIAGRIEILLGRGLGDAAIVKQLRMMEIAGATVYSGILGYGAKGHTHKRSFMHLSRDLPVMISVIDTPEKVEEAANAIGRGDRFERLELAVSFCPDWKYDQPDPFNFAKSRRFVNQHGVEQGTCIHLGNCDIGCDVDAKNTLDKNYIPWAEKHGAQVRPLHQVTNIEPLSGGYRVSFDQLKAGARLPGSVTSRIVILAAGSTRFDGTSVAMPRCEWQPAATQSFSWARLEQQRRLPDTRPVQAP